MGSNNFGDSHFANTLDSSERVLKKIFQTALRDVIAYDIHNRRQVF